MRVQRIAAISTLAAAALAIAVAVARTNGGGGSHGAPAAKVHANGSVHRHPAGTGGGGGLAAQGPPYPIGVRVLRLVDDTRSITLPDGSTEPRTLVTILRYPATGPPGAIGLPNAPVAAGGPFPLVVFGHGFAVTPALYSRLMRSWAAAGYVVAAPVFPLENANAPGGPQESDLANQPADMSFLITRLLSASASGGGPLSGLIDPAKVAVSGQSDGGDTALALAYDSNDRDPRVRAAIILSGAELPGLEGFDFPAGGPPLLATQGTADTINTPRETEAFFTLAHRPKFLLRLLGAEHLPPYSTQQPQLSVVERVTTAFLNGYLKGESGAPARISQLGQVAGVSTLTAEP